MQIKSLFCYFCIVPGLLIATSCGNQVSENGSTASIKTPVTIVNPEIRTVSKTITLLGSSSYLKKNTIRATVSGIIEKVYIVPGESVKSGQMLFTVRTRESAALGKFSQADTALSFKGLINLTSQNEGFVNSVAFQSGDFVQEGDILAVIADSRSFVFILDVPSESSKIVGTDSACSIILPDGTTISGTVLRKLNEAEPQTQTIKYIVRPARIPGIPENLSVSIELVTQKNNNATVLPKQAVLADETLKQFWIMKLVNDSTAVKTDIKKGYENDGYVEIVSPPLSLSDKVILTGNYGLADTARVSVTLK
jgi:hypothetical protein